MKTASLILGIIGGITGLLGSLFGIVFGGVVSAFSADERLDQIFILSVLALILGVVGIIGGAIAKNKPKAGGSLMLIAGIDGLMAISAGYIVAAPLLIVGGIMALLEARKQPDKEKTKGWIWLVIGLIIFALIIAVGAKKENKTENNPTDAQTEQTEENKTPTVKVGEDLRIGDVRWKVLTAENKGSTLKSNNLLVDNKTTVGRFVMVVFEVENLGNEAKTLSVLKLYDKTGKTFVPITNTAFFVPEGEKTLVFETINPNVPKQYVAIYEVPNEMGGSKVENLMLKVGDLAMFTEKEGYIELGL
ncbi:MAG: DUF4064 domain-containing protein [Methanoregula sp.]|jgi:hypothetical protein|nr:DUF4064 domain-containing protein [Methanoregula sp.]